MEAGEAARAARKRVVVADHILSQTYPLVKDPKLLLAVLQNVHDAVDAGISALLVHEHARKRAPLVTGDFTARVAGFQRHVAPLYVIPPEFFRFVGELQETIREHHDSAVEFTRHQQYVICDNNYRIKTLDEERLSRYVERAKAFVALVEMKVTP